MKCHMPGNIRSEIFSRKAYFGAFANLNFHELPQFYRTLSILVNRALPNHVYHLFIQRAKITQEFVCESCMRGHHIYIWVSDSMRAEVLICV